MTSAELDNLVRTGHLKHEPPAAGEVEGLIRSGEGRTYELVDGEIRVSPGGARQQLRLSAAGGALLLAFVNDHRLGHVFGSNTVFRLPGGNVPPPLRRRGS